MIVVARFTEVDEYLAELRGEHARSAHAIDRGIVRVSKLARPGGPGGMLTNVTVHAGAIVRGRLVVLERFVGQLWGSAPGDDEVQDRASEVVAELTAGLRDVGLEVRAGLFEVRQLRHLEAQADEATS